MIRPSTPAALAAAVRRARLGGACLFSPSPVALSIGREVLAVVRHLDKVAVACYNAGQ